MGNWDVAVEFGFDDAFAASKNFYDDACVYVLAMSNGSTEIGMSQQFLSRIIQIEHDTGLEVVDACHSRYMPSQAARALEARLHNYFKEYLCWRREYFSITFDDGVQKLREAMYSPDALKKPASHKPALFTEFKNFIGNRLRYVVDEKRWAMYCSKWLITNGSTAVTDFTVWTGFYDYLKNKNSISGYSSFKRLIDDFSKKIQSAPEYQLHLSDFNSQPYLLNCKNGVVDLRTGTLLPHNPTLLLTLNTNVEYRGLNYHSEEVDRFLKYIMPDDETRKAVLRFLGYALTGYNTEHVAMYICPPYPDVDCGYLHVILDRTLGEYSNFVWGDYNPNDVYKDYTKGRCYLGGVLLPQSRLLQYYYLNKRFKCLWNSTVDFFTDDYRRSKDIFEGAARRSSCKLLIYYSTLRLENIDDVKRFLQVELNYDYSGSRIRFDDKDVQSGFLSVLVQAAMDWFQASEGGNKKGLIESPQMKAYKKSYLKKHGVNLSKRNFEKWLYDTN